MDTANVLTQRAQQVKRTRMLSRIANNERLIACLFILPSLIGFLAFYAVPAVRSVFISFTQWNLLTDPKYVGIGNYQKLIADSRFWQSLGVTVLYVLWNIPIQTVLAMFIAVMMDRIHNSSLLRSVMILPWLVPNVVVALLWLWLLDPSLGLVNVGLQAIGLPRQPFLGSTEQAIAGIAGINIWRYTGYTTIIIFAGSKTIPKTLYEATAIDGANAWVQFWSITLPLLRPVMSFVLVTSVVGSFQLFGTVAVTTAGGPAGATRVIIY
jgi:multiple sugar transport system permease protein